MMRDWTTIIGVDHRHAEEWRITWPTWRRHRPELLTRPLIIFYDAVEPEAVWRKRLGFLDHPDFTLVPWSLDGAEQREKMLNGCVYIAARVETPWYLKLDVDVVAEANDAWFDASWFQPDRRGRTPVFVASPWMFTKPARWIDELERWSRHVPDLAERPPLGLTIPEGAVHLRHRRIISYCFFGRTDWTRQMASYCPERLPVPSQDTFLWYCAAKRGDFYRRLRMSTRGWRHVPCRRLRAAAEKSMSVSPVSVSSEPSENLASGRQAARPPVRPVFDAGATDREKSPGEDEFESARIARAESFLTKFRNRRQVRALAELVPENGTFVDVGGFVGDFTAYVTNVRRCRAILFEPVRGHYEFCRRRFSAQPEVTVEHLALGDAAGETLIYRGHRNLAWNTMVAEMRNGRNSRLAPESVACVAFDDYRAEKGIPGVDVVKIDVEGYEWRVLRGMRRTIAEFLPHLECELHFGTKHPQGDEQASEFEYLFGLGYRRFNIDSVFPASSRRQNAIVLLASPKI